METEILMRLPRQTAPGMQGGGNKWWQCLAVLALLGLGQRAAAQPGKDGAMTVSGSAGTILNEYTPLTATAVVNATTLTVASSTLNINGRFTTDLAAGDLLLLVQPQGADINTADAASYGTVSALNNAGRYQLVEVAAVPSATSITLSCRLFSTYTTAGHAQVVRVPRYTTLDVSPGVAVTAPAWDGSSGGVVAIETTGAVTLGSGASIDVTALGFRGGAVEQDSDAPYNSDLGYRSASATYGAEKGESIAGSAAEYDNLSGRYGRGAPANGGGGGNAHNASGGGGANAAALGARYTGRGNPDRGPGNAYDVAWNLEGANFATAASSGGGRGGYSYSTEDENALALGPGQASWGGDQRQDKGGLGGRPVASSGRAFFGGGGGAGDSNDGNGTAGGAGGGFIYLMAGGAVSGGSLIADGASVTDVHRNDGGGGGGGGGSVVVNATGLVSSALLARGGTGSIQNTTGSIEAEGAGGGGGGGYVAYTLGAPSTDVSGGVNGTTDSPALAEFAPNGATKGAAGRVESGACSALLCPAAVADVATSLSFATNPLPPNQVALVSVTFVNNGPDVAANVVRLVQLPPGLGAGAVTVTTAAGSGSYDDGTGLVTFTPVASLVSGADANATLSFTPPATANVAVASTISTDTNEYCQIGDDTSGDSTLVIILPADLRVTLSGATSATAASSVTYTATLQNISAGPGTTDASNVVLNVQLPKALMSTALPAGTTYDFNTGIAATSVGDVNRGDPALSYTFTFTLPNNTQPAVGIASATATQLDPDPTNNDGVASGMRVTTTVALAAGTGTCAGTTFDNATASSQGLYAEYYKGFFNDVLTYFDASVPDLVRTEGTVDYSTNDGWGDVSSAIDGGDDSNPDGFSARYRGYLTIATAGLYTFSLYSDDAAYLWLDNSARANPLVPANSVVQDGGVHAPRTTTGTPVFLAAGPHPLLALYGEDGGDNRLQLSYSGPDTGDVPVVIPQAVLCNRQFSGPLPVQLTAFAAVAEGRAARLTWRTASELYNDHFDVERSRDGAVFKKIGEMRGFGTSATAHDYAFGDAGAAEAGKCRVYYRLRQVDTNGASQYSPVRMLEFGAGPAGAMGFNLYPNPAQHEVTLELTGFSDTALSTLIITDLAGRVVRQQVLERGATAPTLDLSALPTGVYQVQVEQQGQRHTQRLVHTGN